MKSFNVPLLVLGGGGYTVRNVARCWANETGVLLDEKLSEEIPYNEYYEYYGPDFNLHITPSNMENHNTKKYMEDTKIELFECLNSLPKPTVQIKQMPRSIDIEGAMEVKEGDPDVRISQADEDKMVTDEREFYRDDKDQDKPT